MSHSHSAVRWTLRHNHSAVRNVSRRGMRHNHSAVRNVRRTVSYDRSAVLHGWMNNHSTVGKHRRRGVMNDWGRSHYGMIDRNWSLYIHCSLRPTNIHWSLRLAYILFIDLFLMLGRVASVGRRKELPEEGIADLVGALVAFCVTGRHFLAPQTRPAVLEGIVHVLLLVVCSRSPLLKLLSRALFLQFSCSFIEVCPLMQGLIAFLAAEGFSIRHFLF